MKNSPASCYTAMTFFWALLVLLLAIHATSAAPVSNKNMLSNISICITNCAQCHDLVGDIFEHRRCSRDCVARRGASLPDCTNPESIREYLNLKRPENSLFNPA